MTDTVSPAARSRMMSAVRSSGTGPEEALDAALRALGVSGYERNARLRPVYLYRTADFVFRDAKVAVFVHGCFWHGCPEHYREPKTRTGFWRAKAEANRQRDEAVLWRLEAEGWTVIVLWEHGVSADAGACASRVRGALA